jgi:ABC-2 type transport system ATP-binding protein
VTAGPTLEARGLTRRYGAHAAVTGVSLRVPAGGIHGLLGPNGAGKTTLIGLLLGLVRPDAGGVHVAGRPVTPFRDGLPPEVAGVLDGPRFRPHLSGRANLALLRAYDGSPVVRRPGRTDAQVERLLDEVGLADRAGEPVRAYSLGMRQRLGLAGALLRRPRVLVLDEPANGLDPAGAAQVSTLLRRLQADGVAVLLSSHDLDQVQDLCDEVTVLRRGVVSYQGTIDELGRVAPVPTVIIGTSDDDAALAVGGRLPGVEVGRGALAHRGSLVVRAGQGDLDRYVLELGRAGVAVRRLSVQCTSLRAAFLALTDGDDPLEVVPPTGRAGARGPAPAEVALTGVAS